MENKNKKTLKDYFNELLAIQEVASNSDLVDFINGRIEILDKKNSSDTPSKNQIANESLKNQIYDLMEKDRVYSCSEIAKMLDLSTQKITPQLTKLVKEEKIKRIEDKKAISYQKRV